MNKFRLLKASEIEVRFGNKIKDTNKATVLLYIDSRAVTKLLDETIGQMNWQTEFYEVNGQIIGKLGIWDDVKSQWVWKSDVGSESNIEREKGLISDCYKRLISRWGVTELYSTPSIILEENVAKFGGLKVKEIEYDENERVITKLVIVDKTNKIVFNWSKNDGNVAENEETKVKDNSLLLKQLTDGCSGKKGECDINELTKFFNFWKAVIDKGDYSSNDFKFAFHYNKWFSKK
jgi:hypothetical protein